jgi:hypothetical protein
MAMLAASISTAAVAGEIKQDKKATAPAVSVTQMSDSDMDKVTAGQGFGVGTAGEHTDNVSHSNFGLGIAGGHAQSPTAARRAGATDRLTPSLFSGCGGVFRWCWPRSTGGSIVTSGPNSPHFASTRGREPRHNAFARLLWRGFPWAYSSSKRVARSCPSASRTHSLLVGTKGRHLGRFGRGGHPSHGRRRQAAPAARMHFQATLNKTIHRTKAALATRMALCKTKISSPRVAASRS